MSANRSCLKRRHSIYALLTVFWAMTGVFAADNAQNQPMATPLNNREPIHVTSDTLEVDNRNQSFVFKGNVKAVQGDTVITAERLQVQYQEAAAGGVEQRSGTTQIKSMEASQNVVILFGKRTARAEKAIYDSANETLQLFGNDASVTEGPNSIRGSKITLYRQADRIKVEGSAGKRVEAVFFPAGKDQN
jgi:lipopolysaccharide export system protein LptA